MENLLKQKRVKFSDAQPGEMDISGERRLSQQLSESVIEIGASVGSKLQDWFQKQFSEQMNQNIENYPDKEYAVAVAAAACSIRSLEEADEEHRRKMKQEFELSNSKAKLGQPPSSGRVTRRSSSKDLIKNKGESSNKKWLDRDRRPNETAGPISRPIRPTPSPVLDQNQKRNSSRNKNSGTKADAWERAQMEKINKRYEKIIFGIVSWENEKKTKAKLHMEKKKGELEKRRAVNQQHYQNKIARIDHIAAGAKAQAEEARKKKASEIKRKAGRIRSTGKRPAYCFCF